MIPVADLERLAALYDRFANTLEVSQRSAVWAEIMAFVAEELPVLPIYYYGNGVIGRKGLRNFN